MPDCCHESARICFLAEVPCGRHAPRPGPAGTRPPKMGASTVDVIVERVAGLDAGKASVTVCVRTPGKGRTRTNEVRTYSTMTRQLQVMADWLVENGVTLAAMESTATYWKPVLYCLEERMETWLLNAAHIKAVPGRKSDVRDAEWIARLVEHGLVAPGVRATAGDPPAAQPHQVPGPAHGRPGPGSVSGGEVARGRLDQALGGGLLHRRALGAGDAARPGREGTRPGGDGRSGLFQAAQPQERTGRVADRALRRPPRAAHRRDAAAPGSGRGLAQVSTRRSPPRSRPGSTSSSCCRPSPGSGSRPRRRSSPKPAPTCLASSARRTWRPGPGSRPRCTNRPGSPGRWDTATATSGWPRCWSKPPCLPRGPRPTSAPSSARSPSAAAPSGPPSLPPTRFWSAPTTCSNVTSPTATSARTISAGLSTPGPRPDAWSRSSNATRAHRRPRPRLLTHHLPDPPRQPGTAKNGSGLRPDAAARLVTVIHGSVAPFVASGRPTGGRGQALGPVFRSWGGSDS